MEDVVNEFKNIVEFYSRESKNVLRDQLNTALTTEAIEELRHKDFFKYFKASFEHEISVLVDKYPSQAARVAILNIIQNVQTETCEQLNTFQDNIMKANLLCTLNEYVKESYALYAREKDSLTESDKTKGKYSQQAKKNITLFCHEQKIIESLKCLLRNHMFDEDAGTNYVDEKNYKCDLIYRERSTRIRKFRHYLTTKIKLKKIGQFYKEELSFQINVDLKKACKNIWEYESKLNQACGSTIGTLQQLPKLRFTEVLEEEKVVDLGSIVRKFTHKTLHDLDLTSNSNSSNSDAVQKAGKSKLETIWESEALTVTIKEELNKTLQKEEVQKFLSSSQKNEEISQACNFFKQYTDKLIEENKKKKDEKKITNIQTRILNKTLIVDSQLILDDVECLLQPIIDKISRGSCRYAIRLVEQSNVIVCKLIDVVSCIDAAFTRDDTPQELSENIFLGKIIELLAIDMSMEELCAFKKLVKNISHTKENRKRFLKHLENEIPITTLKLVERSKEVLTNYSDKLDGSNELSFIVRNVVETLEDE